MAHILIMPRQGNTVESCIIEEWKVGEGDPVGEDTTVCVVETDKATFEVPAGGAGQVLKLLCAPGDDVPVLQPIAVIGAPGEDWQAALKGAGADAGEGGGAEALPGSAGAGGAGSGTAPGTDAAALAETALPAAGGFPGGTAVSPRARNRAAAEGLDTTGLPGSGPGGRIIERDVAAALQSRPALTAAARAAGKAGAVFPAQGSGLGGRITAADLAAPPAAAGSAAGETPRIAAAAGTPDHGEGRVTETPIKGIRKLIADRMYRSLAESAQFTLNAAAPVSRMQDLRARMKASAAGPLGEQLGLSKVTVNDLVLFAVSRVLPLFPFMNAHMAGDVRNGEAVLRTFERVHLGVAVDTPKGLMVPVIRNANLLSLTQISALAKRLAADCQSGAVKAGELSGSTFTVTNLGSLGITGFTPVLNAPEVAILGVCGIELKPRIPGESEAGGSGVAFEPHIGFSLTINHQVVDGAPAARFLNALCGALADIDLWLAK
jgi:pyruvate dehydrogenase E2 component (dihydrolipoamide acetyltransferase)